MDKDPHLLRNLPPRSAPEGLWTEIESRLEAPRPARRRTGSLVAAAALVAAVAVAAIVGYAPSNGPLAGRNGGDGLLLASARQASMQLERELFANRTNVLAAGDAVELAWLESELRLTDELLTEQPRDLDLWIKRNEVLQAMARRYDTSDWHSQVRLASY
ncbi:MAG: hypothetical protein ACNS61_04855 [Candidatus Wenzhouxiangella sp. M2_3B_020]